MGTTKSSAEHVWSAERIDKAFLTAESCEKRHVHVARLPRLAPPLHGKPANDCCLPSVCSCEALKVDCRCEQWIHSRRR